MENSRPRLFFFFVGAGFPRPQSAKIRPYGEERSAAPAKNQGDAASPSKPQGLPQAPLSASAAAFEHRKDKQGGD